MPRVTVTALQSIRRALGWSHRDIDFAGGTLGDLLKEIPTQDGRTLYDFLVEDGGIKGDYAVILNESNVAAAGAAGLATALVDSDQVVAMAIVGVITGGCT